MIHLCTLFDEKYLAKGLALIHSLREHNPDFRLYVCAMDEKVFETIERLEDERVSIFPYTYLGPLPRYSWVEFMWMLTPFLMEYCFRNFQVKSLAYVDADLFLFDSLKPLYDEVEQSSTAIIPHRWTPRHKARLEKNGIYNVSWVYARNNELGRNVIQYWGTQCHNWRSENPGDKFSDQIYLDTWPYEYGTRIVEHRGANLAPWNQEQYQYMMRDGKVIILEAGPQADQGGPLDVKQWPLLFYHMHEFRLTAGGEVYRTGYPLSPILVKEVYGPYEQVIHECTRQFQ